MSTPKPAAAGDVELAKSRFACGNRPLSIKANGGGNLAGASSGFGPSSSLGSRLSSLWSDMFHAGLVGFRGGDTSGEGSRDCRFLLSPMTPKLYIDDSIEKNSPSVVSCAFSRQSNCCSALPFHDEIVSRRKQLITRHLAVAIDNRKNDKARETRRK